MTATIEREVAGSLGRRRNTHPMDTRSARERVGDEAWAEPNLLGKVALRTMWLLYPLGVRTAGLAGLILWAAVMAVATAGTFAWWQLAA
jgi:hypothetical protein